jgi:hypothetical protein
MITSIALVLLGAATAATPCEKLATLNIANATITSATVVPEGPPAPRGGGGGRGGGAGRGGAAPAVTGQLGDVLTVPSAGAPALPPAAAGQRGVGARGGGAAAPAQPPANIPEH